MLKNFLISISFSIYLGKDHCCLSFNDGSIKLFKNDDMMKKVKSYSLYDEGKGVNSLTNYNNINILFASGDDLIYRLKINDDLSIDKRK